MSSQRCDDVQQYLFSSLSKSTQESQAAEFGVAASHWMTKLILPEQQNGENMDTEVESVPNIAHESFPPNELVLVTLHSR
jgi:hypothetical protein